MRHAAPAKIPASAGAAIMCVLYAYACELAINHAQSCQKQGALQVAGRLRATVFQKSCVSSATNSGSSCVYHRNLTPCRNGK